MPCPYPVVAFLIGLFSPGLGLVWTGQSARGLRVMCLAPLTLLPIHWFQFEPYRWVLLFAFGCIVLYYAIEAYFLSTLIRAGREIQESDRPLHAWLVGVKDQTVS